MIDMRDGWPKSIQAEREVESEDGAVMRSFTRLVRTQAIEGPVPPNPCA
jgi:hypothetical protein